MNDQFTKNDSEEDITRKLSHVAEQTHANAQFAAELEERLRNTRRPRGGGLAFTLRQISPSLRWAALLILLGVVLSWSIKTLIPAPGPATNNTPVPFPTATPTANVSTSETATPVVQQDGAYEWRGTKLYLAVPLPESPGEANVFMIQPEQPATIQTVRALADQFGMDGEIFEAELEPNAPSAFSVVDGNQRLKIRSDRYFEYILDYTIIGAKSPFAVSNPNAEAIIDEFMRSHGFNFPYRVEPSELFQSFYVQALTPDGFPIHHEFFSQNGLLFRLNDTQIVSVSGSLLRYDRVGIYKIKSAQEALQQVAASADFNGMIEGVHSSGRPPQIWRRDYPLNETVTIYGFLNVNKSADGTQLLASIDHFIAKGNLDGIEAVDGMALVKATGHFTLENDSKVFNVDSWEVYKRDDHGASGKDALMGTLQRQGADVVFISDKGSLLMPDVPAELPLPLENAYVYGVILDHVFEWEGIQHAEVSNRGGGGSNGTGFYKLNLNGPPVPFPSPTAQPQNFRAYIIQEGDTVVAIAEAFGVTPEKVVEANAWLREDHVLRPGKTLIIPAAESELAPNEYIVQENDTLSSIALNFGITVDELMQANGLVSDTIFTGQTLFIPGQQTENPYIGRRFEQQRGVLSIVIYNRPDGTSRTEFNFSMENEDGSIFNALLENVSLEALRPYHHLPLDIWGTIERVNENGTPIISVERYEIPFPDLHIQLLKGKQRLTEIEGQQVALFTTTDGTTYAQMVGYGTPDTTILGYEGDDVILETLAIPGETFGGYPALYVFGGSTAINPKNNQPVEPTITANQPYVVEEMVAPEAFVAPNATIENVELVYYTPNSRYVTFSERSDAEYIQPAWRFYGHYENGDEFEILIQALRQDYLLPELVPYTRPG
jgi:LysM repeat protein